MKTSSLVVVSIVIALFAGSCSSNLTSVKLKSKEDSLAYAFGIYNYNQLIQDSIILDPMIVAKAMSDSEKGEAFMEDMDARNFIMAFVNEREVLRAEQKAILDKELYKEHIAANEAFLEKNKEKDGVTVTTSGLQYEVIKMGTGPKPTSENTVRVHYVGTLIDGTEFDSSVGKEPAQFQVLGVIPGWSEALQLMPVGSKFKVVIPENLAYGATGAGEAIKPFSALVFEVELLEIVQ